MPRQHPTQISRREAAATNEYFYPVRGLATGACGGKALLPVTYYLVFLVIRTAIRDSWKTEGAFAVPIKLYRRSHARSMSLSAFLRMMAGCSGPQA